MEEIALLAACLAAQYALLFGASYLVYRFLVKRSSYLKTARRITRAFAVVASLFALGLLLIAQLLSPAPWWWVFAAPLWVASLFLVHDLALTLAIRQGP